MFRGEKWGYAVKSEMSYFRLSLILHYSKSHWKLFFISTRNIYERPIEYLLVVVSSAVVRSMPDTKFFQNWQGLFNFFFSSSSLISSSAFFILLFQSIFDMEPKFKETVFRYIFIYSHISYVFFSDWTILWYKNSLNRGVQWSANSSL